MSTPARPVVLFEPIEPRLLFAVPGGFQETTVLGPFTSRANTMEFSPDGRLFIADSGNGRVRVLKNGALLPTPALTLSLATSGERGINGIAFDPNFANNGYLYVYYTRPDNPATTGVVDPGNRLVRYKRSATNGDVFDPASARVLLDNIPSPGGGFHQGGALHFGTDGMLYLGVGDGATGAAAQDLNSLGGKVLRLNVANTSNLIPPDNPFAGQAGRRPEIWAYGFRNPFTGNVDTVSGKIYINDVGQNAWEEVDHLQKGKNYGWPAAEGNSTNAAFTNPVHAYAHTSTQRASIAGGVFYDGGQFPASFNGKYFFGDFVRGTIRVLDPNTRGTSGFGSGFTSLVDLDVAPDGTLYALSVNGTVRRVRNVAAGAPTVVRPSADAYVRDGTSANTNFGNATDLWVKKHATIGLERETYLRFSIAGLSSSSLGTVKLRLFGKLIKPDAAGVRVALYPVGNTTWSESGITYANRPASGTAALPTSTSAVTVTGGTGRWYEFDVTSYVRSRKAAAATSVSFAIKSLANTEPAVSFNSDEATFGRPRLVVAAPATTAAAAAAGAQVTASSGITWGADRITGDVDDLLELV